MDNSYEIPEYLIKLKLLFLEGIKRYHHSSPIGLDEITDKLNDYLKKNQLMTKKIPAKEIKRLIRWLIKKGEPVGVLNGERYYWAFCEGDLAHSLEQLKAKLFWIEDMVKDMEKVHFEELNFVKQD